MGGTNLMFKRKDVMQVGGFDESSIVEDMATSIELKKKGYSRYHPL